MWLIATFINWYSSRPNIDWFTWQNPKHSMHIDYSAIPTYTLFFARLYLFIHLYSICRRKIGCKVKRNCFITCSSFVYKLLYWPVYGNLFKNRSRGTRAYWIGEKFYNQHSFVYNWIRFCSFSLQIQ